MPLVITLPVCAFPEVIQYNSHVVDPVISLLPTLHTVALISLQSPLQPAMKLNELLSHTSTVGVMVGVSVAVGEEVGVKVAVVVPVEVEV